LNPSFSILFILLGLIVFCALAAVFTSDLLAAVALLGCYSLFLAVFWSLIGAVDVSFTEAMVGSGVSTVFFLVTLLRTDRYTEKLPRGPFFWGSLALMGALGLVLLGAMGDLPAFGDHASPPNSYLSPEFLKRSLADTHTPNVVTSVLADYRSFDTLIETTVILTAGVACYLLMRRKKVKSPS